MNNLWKGRQEIGLSDAGKAFNDSIGFDHVMFEEDIEGSVAHAHMLGQVGIISKDEAALITSELEKIKEDIKSGAIVIDFDAEDIHTFVEMELTKRIGDVGKKLHTARARNDQTATTAKLYLRKRVAEVQKAIAALVGTINEVAEEHLDTIMPGFTHLQLAQPITLAHHLIGYNAMLMRDYERIEDCLKRFNTSPLGAGALAGTTFPIDREMTSQALGFTKPAFNSMDAISARDHVIELASACAILMMHLSRMCEDIIIWNNQLFGFITLDDAHSTGSSMMPQKKNPDLAELVRGKSGRVYGNLTSLLTIMKGLAMSYNKDMQEDKEPIFDSLQTVLHSLEVMKGMLGAASFNKEAMLAACQKGMINATDCADYLVGKGMAFRDAYKIVGGLTKICVDKGVALEDISISEYKELSPMFDKDVYEAINLQNCVEKRKSQGGPAKGAVMAQINICEEFLKELP